MTDQNKIKWLRIIAWVEVISFLLILFITMPLKYIWNTPEPNKFIGMAHGILFIMYVLAVIMVAIELNWKAKTIFWALIASILPFGTFIADRKIFNQYVQPIQE